MRTHILASLSVLTLTACIASADISLNLVGPLPGGTGAFLHGVSPDGSTAVGYSTDGYADRVITWTAAGGTADRGVGIVNGTSRGMDINNTGDIAGYGYNSSWTTEIAFIMAAGGGNTTFPSSHGNSAAAITADGTTIVGGAQGDGMNSAAKMTGGVTYLLPPLTSGVWAGASDVSADGSIVVGYSRTHTAYDLNRAVYWTGLASPVNMGVLPGAPAGAHSNATGISQDGTMIVGQSGNAAGRTEAFLWTAGTGMQGLGTVSSSNVYSSALAVSNSGSVVGTSSNDDGDYVAFVWDATNGMRDLNTLVAGLLPSGWSLMNANDISDDGTVIVGTAFNESTWSAKGFVLTMPQDVPEPTTMALLGLGAVALIRRRNTSIA